MSTPSTLFKLARNKLSLSVGGKDNCNLHRWVLLKNSISSSSLTTTSPSTSQTDLSATEEYYVEDEDEEETDSFMFPDASKLDNIGLSTENAEAQWLDSLLADLADEDEDIVLDFDVNVSVLPVDDEDEESLLSPLSSPLSSSDNLLQPDYYPPSLPYPYPMPYPPFHPPLMNSYHLDSNNSDDFDDMSVPEAIEDTSDDESEGHPVTPSLTNSSTSSLDPASIPLPREREPPRLHVYIDTDDFHPFHLDPLPFSTHSTHRFTTYPYNPYHQDC